MASLRRNAAEMWLELGCLAGGRYPAFVTARRASLPCDSVPVFVLHTVKPEEFDAQLRYLVDSGYRTIGIQEFFDHLTGTRPAPPGSVLLTIDDGRASAWSVAEPLLRKYGQKAVVFLIPGYVAEGDGARATLEDVWSGRIAPAQLPRRDPALMTWPEVRKAAESGALEFESHTLYHHEVPVSHRIVGYLGPGETRALFDLPVEPGREQDVAGGDLASLFGLPIYESAPLMSGRPCYRPDPELASRCMAHVAAAGGAAFFRSPDWRQELDARVAEYRSRNGKGGRMLTAHEQRAAMVDDLRRAREVIEERLERPVRHLCYPYTAGSDLAVAASREAGYLTNFWGVLPERSSNRPGEDPYRCPRLKADYLFRLPGCGRQSLAGVIAQKVRRRASGAPVY